MTLDPRPSDAELLKMVAQRRRWKQTATRAAAGLSEEAYRSLSLRLPEQMQTGVELPPPILAKPLEEESDMCRAFGLLDALCWNTTEEKSKYEVIVVDGEPYSKARPRFSRNGHVYRDPKQAAAEKALSATLHREFGEPRDGNLALVCVFFRKNEHRVDVDNLLKHVMDAANKVVWRDDYQVTGITGVLELDAKRPRTVIGIARHRSTMVRDVVRTRACATCSSEFRLPSRKSRQKFCSSKCWIAKRTDLPRLVVPCDHCGKLFQQQKGVQKFCSKRCAYAGRAA